ncbi:MAG: choline-sulfatase [Planctomycetota bacterium]
MNRPNILMIMADQLPAATIGAYGHPIVKTPHMDRLAERGILFENCYTNCPLCAPARAAMCTGKLVGKIGAFDNGTELPAQIPTFLHHLRRAGYETILSGKMHFIGPDQLHGFERRLTTDIYPSFFNWTPDWRKGVYANPGTSVSQLAETGLCTWNLQLDYDEEVQFRALECLRDLARRQNGGRPFFLCASYTHPHDPWLITRKYWDRYDHDEIDMPAAPAVPMEDMHPFDRWLQIHHMVDKFPPTDEMIRTTRHAFYGMIAYFDEKVGELLDEMDRLGLAENTIVLLTSDHGEMMGEHGMWFKRTFFDWSARIPFLAAWPGRWPGGRRAKGVISLVDLFPTILDIASLDDLGEVAATVDGNSFSNLLEADDPAWKDYAISEYYGEGVIQAGRMLRKGRHKYIYVHEEAPRLFDMEADPNELNDLAGAPEAADVETEMRALILKDWDVERIEAEVMRSQQDRFAIKEAVGEDHTNLWDFQPPFDARQQYVRLKDAQEMNKRMRYPKA